MATISDVAQLTGVSTATVSRVVNTPEVVNAETRAIVQAGIHKLNYRPNRAAQTLKSRTSKTVGVVVNRFSSPYFGNIIAGAETTLRNLDYKTIAEASHETAEGQIAAWMSLVARQCDSYIVHADLIPEGTLADMMAKYPNTVLINRELPGFADRTVRLDNVHAGQLAAQHLLSKGHRKVATVTGPMQVGEMKDRHRGFINGLAEGRVSIPAPQVVSGQLSEISGFNAMNQLLDLQRSITAVFFHNDLMAAGGIEACRKRNINVPEDVSIIGFDDVDLARHLSPKLTTVRQPMLEIGSVAGTVAQALAANTPQPPSLKKVFYADFIVRGSVQSIA